MNHTYHIWEDYHFLFILLFSLLFFSKCVSIKKAKSIQFVVRENPHEVIDKVVDYQILDLDHNVLTSGQTNELGYFKLERSVLSDQLKIDQESIFKKIIIKVKSDEDEAEIYLNDYLTFYDIFLSDNYAEVKQDEKIADMHYHISMRSHNKFAYQFHQRGAAEEMPTNINWDKSYKKLRVLYKGSWKRPKFSFSNQKDKDIMRELFSSGLIKTKEGANTLKHYSQATHPNTVEGNVFLGFNAISPFEYNVSKTGLKRVISSSFKSGVPIKWLELMGKDKDDHLTHWENFNVEYKMINSQDRSFNNFAWEIYEKPSDLAQNPTHPVMVNVVEGGHILQDRYFPHFVEYDLTQKHLKNKTALFEKILSTAELEPKDHWTLDYWKSLEDEVVEPYQESLDRVKGMKGKQTTYRGERYSKQLKREVSLEYTEKKDEAIEKFVTGVLMRELNANIDTLKEFTNIQMMAIGHLAYNGMTGHSLAIDVSKKPPFEYLVSQIVKRAYRTKSSSDVNYRKSFNGLFFTIPGVNKYGENVITRLLDDSLRRIQIDLKHSDVPTRAFILNQYEKLDLPPICSHCAVTGISKNFSSPVVDEYSLLNSSLARKFYPFSINLFNEEITQICKEGGIIGIPLEERVLGRYVDNKIEYPIKIKLSNAPKLLNKVNRNKRIKYTEKGIKYLRFSNNQDFHKAAGEYLEKFTSEINFDRAETTEGLPGRQRNKFHKVFLEDYLSAEAFLQNLFHIVDLTHLALKDSLEFDETYLQFYSQNSAISQKSILSTIKGRELPPDQQDILRIRSWQNICLGSDLDGLIDPLNICPTASDYPTFKRKLKLFIPLFLTMRKTFEERDNVYGEYRIIQDYFSERFTLDDALNMVFFQNLMSFTREHF